MIKNALTSIIFKIFFPGIFPYWCKICNKGKYAYELCYSLLVFLLSAVAFCIHSVSQIYFFRQDLKRYNLSPTCEDTLVRNLLNVKPAARSLLVKSR